MWLKKSAIAGKKFIAELLFQREIHYTEWKLNT